MIVYTDAFLLAAAAAAPSLVNPRIGWKNYLFEISASDLNVSGETAGGPRDAVLTPDTAQYWEPDALPAWMIVDLREPRTINYFGLAGHNFGSVHASLKVEIGTNPGFEDGATTFAQETAPSDDTPIMLLDSDRYGRWLRITINGSVPPKVAAPYAGPVLAMQKAVSGPYKPISRARKSELKRVMSRNGQFLGQTFRRNGVESEISFKNLTNDWALENFEPFSKHARSLPYFLAWNPADFPREVGFVWTDKDIVPVLNGNGFDMDVSWATDGIGNE